MFIDEDGTGAEGSDHPGGVCVQAVLAACAAEAVRQAQVMSALDASIGSVLTVLRRGSDGQVRHPPSGLVTALQQADRLRQEMEGLAKVLILLTDLGRDAEIVDAGLVRACTPFRELQERLLGQAGGQETVVRRQATG
jgi:hypothetical protein